MFRVSTTRVKVSALESIISRGGKVVETDLLGLVELLMNQLVKLDAIVADGDVKVQRKLQVLTTLIFLTIFLKNLIFN